jgi:5-methylcytosine-specific restriction enzyme A
MQEPLFILGKNYRRSEIHDRFGGNRQAGISVSSANPYIFIFSGQTGHQHGYIDRWENENVFSYTGEGQIGDMQLTRGNLSLYEHLRTGKRVFLFLQEGKGYWKFEAEVELDEVDTFVATDREGNDRIGIKFFLKKVGVLLSYKSPHLSAQLLSNPGVVRAIDIPDETERRGLVTSRVGQGAYRKSILYRWNFKCAVTNYTKNEILIASHIVPWKNASNADRLNVHNGILLSPTYDALFDRHLISFENSGKIILSESVI